MKKRLLKILAIGLVTILGFSCSPETIPDVPDDHFPDAVIDSLNPLPDLDLSEGWTVDTTATVDPQNPDVPLQPETPEEKEARLLADFQTFSARATGKTHSAQTPMGKHFNGKPAATAEDKTWLADPAQEPYTKPGFANKALPGQTDKEWVTYSSFKLYPFGRPSPVDVNQHAIGDCCLCAVLAEMAYIFPDFIQNHVIKDNGDGTFDVAMYDPMGNPITVGVSNKFLAGNTQVGGKNGPAWSTVMEKAVIKYHSLFEIDAIGGIGTEFVVPLFTGNGDSFAFSPGSLSATEMVRCLDAMFYKRMFVIGGFKTNGVNISVKLINHDGSFQYNTDGSVKTTNATTVSGHAFSFMYSVDPDALFSMRNPWGSNPADGRDGTLDIPDNGEIQPLIDMRIVYPGAAEPYAIQTITPYFRPW